MVDAIEEDPEDDIYFEKEYPEEKDDIIIFIWYVKTIFNFQ
jgi:hypothetical protein